MFCCDSDCVSFFLSGNCLGESGKEALRELLEAKGLADCLKSLSDDEGTDSEGEGGEEHEGEGEEEEGGTKEEIAGTQRTAASPPEEQVSFDLCRESRYCTNHMTIV